MSDLNLVQDVVMREADGVVWLEVPMGRARALFSTRVGGESLPPRDTLNLGIHVEPDPMAAHRNRERFCRAAGIELSRIALARQVHGSEVRSAEEVWALSRTGAGSRPAADGLLRTALGLTPVVQVADCAAVVVADPASGIGAALHAGWRGAHGMIVENGVRAVAEASGRRVGDLEAAIGPCARGCCYEVGDDVREAFGAQGFPVDALFARRDNGRYLFDLGGAIRHSLQVAGLPEANVHDVGACTLCRGDLFFSYRREGPETGRMWGCLADA
jgi:polyphenol oxidase